MVTPSLFYFYSSGAIEDKWTTKDLGLNRIVSSVGISFGAVLSIALLVVAALTLHPRGIQVDRYEQAALLLTQPLGRWGFILFVATLAVACFGAALETSLALAYLVAQGFGWKWGEDQCPRDAARFALVYTVAVLLATLVVLTGIDPLKLTVMSMALTAASLPVAIGPFVLLMNDERYVGSHRNGWLSNIVIVFSIALAFVLAVVSIPLELMAG